MRFYFGPNNLHSKQGVQYEMDYKVEEFGGSIWIICNILCSLHSTRTKTCIKVIHVYVFPYEDLGHWIMNVCRVDCNPKTRRRVFDSGTPYFTPYGCM